MRLSDLPEIDFVEVDSDAVQQSLFDSYTEITGRTLAKGDPIRLFILYIADVVVQIMNNMNDTGKQNLLKYAAGDNLDNLAAFLEVVRLPSSAATTTIKVMLSAERTNEIIVPKGTRVSAGGDVYFATDSDLVIPAGELEGLVDATCTVNGTTGNDFLPGELSTIVDPVSYVQSMTNTTRSEGGSDVESDDALRERVFKAPESFSTAGPTGAYEFHAKSVNSSITDVYVYSPEPGIVNVYPLVSGGEIPGEELLDSVYEYLNDDKIRPLTDYVQVLAPGRVPYEVAADYYVEPDADVATVSANAMAAVQSYIKWQKEKLGRDINPSKLVQLLMSVNGVKRVEVTKPAFTVLKGNQIAQEGRISVTMAGSEDE